MLIKSQDQLDQEVDMANLTRWEPFRELMEMRRDWDRLFDDNLFRPLWTENGHSAPTCGLVPDSGRSPRQSRHAWRKS
jgi:hypothetical protein